MLKQRIEVGTSTCLMGFNAGKQYMESVVFDASTLQAPAGPGTNEVQTVTITGTPTGGTFTLSFRGATTAGIAYNATADAVETALEAISTIGDGDVRVTGGPGPGTPYVVTFINDLGHQNVDAMTASGASLTGGTTPAVTVAQTTAGSDVGYDPRITLGTYAKPGTIVKKKVGPGANDDTVVEYDGTGAIYGIVDGEEEFFAAVAEASRSLPVYRHMGLVVDARKVKDYTTNKTAIDAWALTRAIDIKFG